MQGVPPHAYIRIFHMKSVYSKEYQGILLKLKKARRKAGLTQVDIAKQLDKPQSFVSKIENGERRLDVIELKQIARLYKINAKDFLA
jgi:transcriptional regulator with XRE-family HTH domain